MFDKELIGAHFGFRCRKEDAIEALKDAVLSRFPTGKIPDDLALTLRLDRSCQFTAFEFANAAKILNIQLEFCDVQATNQKPFIESFFSNFKRQEVYRNHYQNPIQALQDWPDYRYWYNNLRPHASIGMIPHVRFRQFSAAKSSQVHDLVLSKNMGA